MTPTNSAHRRTLIVDMLVCMALFGMIVLARPGDVFGEEPTSVPQQELGDLERQIQDRRSKIAELEQQQQIYQENIERKKGEITNLTNQLDVLDNQIASTDLNIHKLALQIETLDIEIKTLEQDITKAHDELVRQQSRLAEIIRELNRYTRKTALEISLSASTFSEFYNQLRYLEMVEQRAKETLDDVTAAKERFEERQKAKETKKQESKERKQDMERDRKIIAEEQAYRENLLSDTEASQDQFEALLQQSKQEQLTANSDIQTLESQIRQRLQEDGELPQNPGALIWPIPSRRITTKFHDPTYVFRRYFEHPAIDVGTPQGTPLRAAASGVVGRAKDAGLGYSYIMIVHGDGLSTVYGHVSQISVVEGDFVVQGQVVGFSGGMPGTRGAGRLTTGPHLHFEVRQNGVPIDPLTKLP